MFNKSPKLDYGIDAPGLVLIFFYGGIAAFIIFCAIGFLDEHYFWRALAQTIFFLIALYMVGMFNLMRHESKITKVRERENILNQLQWRGDERVLDVGCGRGLMLIGAAKRLTTGKAVGIDIWQAKDQSNNTMQGALDNALIEGVSDKIEVQTADMRILPFEECTFDVVVSHWVVHNLEKETDRNKTINEMVRVLRPNGQLILTDISNRGEYLKILTKLELKNIRVVNSPLRDFILGALSFGSFKPATIFVTKPNLGTLT